LRETVAGVLYKSLIEARSWQTTSASRSRPISRSTSAIHAALGSVDRKRNINGLLRQYFPKGLDISGYSQAQLSAIAGRLNERARKDIKLRNIGSPALSICCIRRLNSPPRTDYQAAVLATSKQLSIFKCSEIALCSFGEYGRFCQFPYRLAK